MLKVDVLLTEKRLAEEFLAALERRYLAEKFFYWSPLSVKAWLDLCRETPYRNYSRSYELVSKHASEIAARASDCSSIVSLGAGQGDKDLLLLEAFRAQGKTPVYKPVDSSQALLEMALNRASDAGFISRGLKADLENPETAVALAAHADEPRLYLVLGNSLGVTGPLESLIALRRRLRPQDRILLDGEIFSAEATMAGYDNPLNRRFAFAPLASLGLEEGRDGTLVFENEADGRRDGLNCVTKHFRVARRLRVPVAGQSIEFQAGEKIPMSPSWKYSRPAFLGALREIAGLKILSEYTSADGLFLMALAAPEAG